MTPLPVDEHIPRIVTAVRESRAAVITAPPGAGKTTRIPPALLEDGPAIVLQPRRVAARAIARRIALERGWTVGAEVGWQVRFEHRFEDRTRLLIVTEGILTARLQRDPLLSEFATIVLDEFHERSVHADVGLALARQAWLARSDLRIVVMSATLDAGPVSRFLGGCPVVDVPGRLFPVDIQYAPSQPLAGAVGAALSSTSGDLLCFLPGAPEIERASGELARAVPDSIEIVPLHGSLNAEAQDAVFAPAARRRVVLATNIAETSITVPRVTGVVDTGLQKVARYDGSRAIDSLVLERATLDSADQRAGRAGRIAPGIAIRLWDARDRLRPHRQPEIARVDLSSTVLDVLAWGGDPASMEWFEAPPADALDAAFALLGRLGAIREGRLTPLGRALQRLPLHPRLARILVAAGGAWEAAIACAVLSERGFVPERGTATTSDVLAAIDDIHRLPPHVRNVARQIQRIAQPALAAVTAKGTGRGVRGPSAESAPPPHRATPPTGIDETGLRRALLAGYPDRVAQRRAPSSPRLLLASGTGAVLASESGVVTGEFLVALDVQAGSARRSDAAAEARVRLASLVDRDWLTADASEVEYRFDARTGTVRAVEIRKYGALTIGGRPAAADPDRVATLLAEEYVRRGPSDDDRLLLRRLEFAGRPAAFAELAARAARRARRLDEISLSHALGAEDSRALETLAPARLRVPSGRTVPLDYRDDGTVAAAVKLQELFGLTETPRVGARREPVVLSLLAPNGRPVQTTTDLRSFWEETYPEVRTQLRARYPKHAWPEDTGEERKKKKEEIRKKK